MTKINFLSLSRVVATLFIVLCHIISKYSFIPGYLFLGHFFNVGVPMFIFISGYLYGNKSLNGSYTHFYLRRFLKVSLPVQLFALMLFIVLGESELRHTIIVLLNLQGIGFILKIDGLGCIEAGSNLSHTWFITVILICYLFTPFLQKLKEKGYLTLRLIICLCMLSFVSPFVGLQLSYFTTYVIGYYISSNNILKQYNIIVLFFVLIGGIVLRLLGRYTCDGSIFYNEVLFHISHFLVAISIIFFIREFCNRKAGITLAIVENRVFRFVEKYSLYIYITHYCLIPPLFNHYGLLEATAYFVVLTLTLSIVLGQAHMLIEKGKFLN